MSAGHPANRAELIEALLLERFGHVHPEYHSPRRDQTAEISGLRLVVDNERRAAQERRGA